MGEPFPEVTKTYQYSLLTSPVNYFDASSATVSWSTEIVTSALNFVPTTDLAGTSTVTPSIHFTDGKPDYLKCEVTSGGHSINKVFKIIVQNNTFATRDINSLYFPGLYKAYFTLNGLMTGTVTKGETYTLVPVLENHDGSTYEYDRSRLQYFPDCSSQAARMEGSELGVRPVIKIADDVPSGTVFKVRVSLADKWNGNNIVGEYSLVLTVA